MAATLYCINTTLAATGQTHKSDYWPDGEGRQWPGYVSSMAQYCAELSENLTSSSLRLYVVTTSGRAKLISDDHDLTHAVHSLPDGGVLSVTAIAHSNDQRKNRGRVRGRSRRRRNATDEDWNARRNATGKWWYDDETYSSDEDERENEDVRESGSGSGSESESDEGEESGIAARIETSDSKVNAIVERFDVHADDSEAECYHCDGATWSGVRYCYASNTEYSLCPKCYGELPKGQKEDWEWAGSVWESDAPDYPLYREGEPTVRPEVRHLQYILTRLGFMSLDATKQLVGSYQSNTENAVRRFREHYGIRGGDMSMYNGKTARKMGEVVRQLRQRGHKYM